MISIFNGPRKYPALYEPYYEHFDFYGGRANWLRSIETVPTKAVHLFALHWLHLEVCNGGFWQYFWNSTSTSMPEAVAGFRAIGMPEVAELIENAARKLGPEFPFDREDRIQIIEKVRESEFDAWDKQFYELADTPKFFRRVPKFVPFADAYAASA